MTNCSKLLALSDLSTPNRSSILVAAAVGVGAAAAYGAYRYPRCGYYPYPPCYWKFECGARRHWRKAANDGVLLRHQLWIAFSAV